VAAQVYGVHRSLGPTQTGTGGKMPQPSRTTASSFRRAFEAEMDRERGVAFSAHARERLRLRRVDVGQETQMRLMDAVDRAAAKGGRSSLVLIDDLAFVVSVPNRTVITAMDRSQCRDSVFTHIDSAVVL
jgi:flagellar operon protein